MMWHTERMPDGPPPNLPRRNPDDIDLGRIQTDLEFLIERVSKLPTRQELALRPIYDLCDGRLYRRGHRMAGAFFGDTPYRTNHRTVRLYYTMGRPC
jgi:hypothetical protein